MAESGQSGKLAVRLVTPDRVLFDATADAVELPSASGYLEALYGAAPLLAELGAGDQKFFVAWGFVEVLPERVTILAETALKPEEIDKAASEADLKHGQELWAKAGDNAAQYDEANEITRKAEEELASADGKSH
jgi:F-type H+-transporting ATPase subunit epsilon